ncbi:MAG TPA: gluconokinase [Ktedonobacteraceae bacterium]|nr:gluconokinase [Ktedonobacteraceae bacterium]
MAQQANLRGQGVREPFILALDVGTSSTRALLFDANGDAVRGVQSQHTYELTLSADGEVSVDPNMLVETVARTIDEALHAAGPLATSIGVVAIDTFWHSLMGVDANNKPLTPLITWEDTRPRHAAEELRAQLNNQQIHARTGARLHASYWPAKLRWLGQTQPDVFSKVAQWISFGEYLHRQFVGSSVCSLSMASGTGLLNIRRRDWDSELLDILHVRREQLPPLGDLKDSVSGLTDTYASRWPALRTVPWFPAVGDGAAANVGSGAATGDRWALTVGTSSAMRVIVSPDNTVIPMGLWLYLLDTKRGLLGGALSEGGNVFAWMKATLCIPSLEEAEPQVAALQPDGHGLTILPFISGERSLGWHAGARATVMGIHTDTKPVDILRAGMEALAYQLGAVYEQLITALDRNEVAPTILGSGGALLNSPTFQSIIADTLNTPIYPSLGHEASARGVALLALEALGILPDVANVPLEVNAPVLPDTERHAIYQQGAERQEKLYHLLLG